MQSSLSLRQPVPSRTDKRSVVRADAPHTCAEQDLTHDAWPVRVDVPAEKINADMQRRVRSFLATRSEPGLRRIDIEADGSRITLRGQVRSYYERQLAVHCCRRVAGVTEVVDHLLVHNGSPE